MATVTKAVGNAWDDNAVGSLTWNNLSNVYADDTSFANANHSGGTANSHYLHCDTFAMGVPAYSTINGITVRVHRKGSADTSTNYARDVRVSIVKSDGSVGSSNKGDTVNNWPTTEATATYGGASDLWGETWSVSDVNNNNFGVVIQAVVKSSSLTVRYAYVDYVEIEIDYTAGSPPASTGNFLMFFN